MVQMLLEEGASVLDDGGGPQFQTAIMLAERDGHNAVAKLIRLHHPDVEERSAVWEVSDDSDDSDMSEDESTGAIEVEERAQTVQDTSSDTDSEEWERLIEWSPI
jgi:hypothetical protein